MALYIPHGSDERCGRRVRRVVNRITLYPTWFRWKLTLFDALWTSWYSLYPTWFRWKPALCKALIRKNCAFISHMVQMKVGRSYKAFCTASTLYPTWFRWKADGVFEGTFRLILYIPHGSDERLYIYCMTQTCVVLYIPHNSDERRNQLIMQIYHRRSLYPTWFRWKFNDYVLSSLSSSLYIPHGSDESCFLVDWKIAPDDLYIPHGSDESCKLSNQKFKLNKALYPTWFRWKPYISKVKNTTVTMYFISHMVQMKAIYLKSKKHNRNNVLYIPHGSDERELCILT